MENVPFGPAQQKTLRLQTTDNVYINLGLLLSDQSVRTVKLAVLRGLKSRFLRIGASFPVPCSNK